MIRNAEFYDFIAQGLISMGYVDGGRASLEMYLNDMFAEKWNAEATYAQMGFPLDPDIRLHPTYEQIEATIRPYTMAAYVDYDSDGRRWLSLICWVVCAQTLLMQSWACSSRLLTH